MNVLLLFTTYIWPRGIFPLIFFDILIFSDLWTKRWTAAEIEVCLRSAECRSGRSEMLFNNAILGNFIVILRKASKSSLLNPELLSTLQPHYFVWSLRNGVGWHSFGNKQTTPAHGANTRQAKMSTAECHKFSLGTAFCHLPCDVLNRRFRHADILGFTYYLYSHPHRDKTSKTAQRFWERWWWVVFFFYFIFFYSWYACLRSVHKEQDNSFIQVPPSTAESPQGSKSAYSLPFRWKLPIPVRKSYCSIFRSSMRPTQRTTAEHCTGSPVQHSRTPADTTIT